MSWSLLVSCEVLSVKRLCFHYFLLFSSFPLHLFVFFLKKNLVSLFRPFSFFEGVRGEVGGRLIIHQVPYGIHFGRISLHY